MSQEVQRGPLSRRKDKPLPRMEGDSKETFRLPHPPSGRAATPLGSQNSLGTYPYTGGSIATKPKGQGSAPQPKWGPAKRAAAQNTGQCQGRRRDGSPESQLNRLLWVAVGQGFLVLWPPFPYSQLSLQ